MNITKKGLFTIGLLTGLLLMIPASISQNTENTTIEIINISGSVGGITVDVENTGNAEAKDIWVITTITGGIFGNIDLTHECTGCSACGTTLAPGSIKSENSLEAGLLLGFGSIQITTSAGASNADEVSMETSGSLLGLLVLLQ
jgi:hypothetical protein